MHAEKLEETPRAVAFRIFGATAGLLVAMLVFLHPESMYAAMHGVMAMMP